MTERDARFTLQDSFYKRHTPEEVALAHANRIDFDHPDAIDMPLFTAVRTFSYVSDDSSISCIVSCGLEGLPANQYSRLLVCRTPAVR